MATRVLFSCIHNSARSQMAEAFLKKFGGDRYEVESAGIEPGTLNPIVVQVMQEIGIDISQNKTTGVDELLRAGKTYDYVVTVCDEASAERCPVFPGKSARLHWGFEDPSSFEGADEEKKLMTRKVRDAIREKVVNFVNKSSQLLVG